MEGNLYASILSLALRDALEMSISVEACRAREWWTSQEYVQDIETFCDVLSLNSKMVRDGVKKNIKERLMKNFINLEEQRILKIEKEEQKLECYKKTCTDGSLVRETMREIERLKKLPENGYGCGEVLRSDDVRITLMSKIGSKYPRTAEGILSHKIAVLLKNMTLDGSPLVWFHVPNEAGRSGMRYGMALNAIGRIAGAPDYVVTTPRGTIFLEVKSGDGKLSERQKDFQAWCDIVGTKYIRVNDVESVRRIVDEYI